MEASGPPTEEMLEGPTLPRQGPRRAPPHTPSPESCLCDDPGCVFANIPTTRGSFLLSQTNSNGPC